VFVLVAPFGGLASAREVRPLRPHE